MVNQPKTQKKKRSEVAIDQFSDATANNPRMNLIRFDDVS